MGVFSGARVAAPQRSSLLAPVLQRRGAVQVVAAEQQKKKRTPQPVKRAQLSEERRMRNKPRKSAIATRMKKVIAAATALHSGGRGRRDVGWAQEPGLAHWQRPARLWRRSSGAQRQRGSSSSRRLASAATARSCGNGWARPLIWRLLNPQLLWRGQQRGWLAEWAAAAGEAGAPAAKNWHPP